MESFQIEAEFEDGGRYPIYQGTVIGNCKLCKLRDPFEGQNPLTDTAAPRIMKLMLRITSARDEVILKEIKVY